MSIPVCKEDQQEAHGATGRVKEEFVKSGDGEEQSAQSRGRSGPMQQNLKARRTRTNIKIPNALHSLFYDM